METSGEGGFPQRRATDGLDWFRPPEAPPSGQPPEVPSLEASPAPVADPGMPEGGTTLPSPVPLATRPGRAGFAVAALAGGLAGGLIAGLLVWLLVDGDSRTPASNPGAQETPAPAITRLEVTSAISAAAARGRESVVRIESFRRVAGGLQRDVGSGVVMDQQGHIVTNAHVVMGTESLKVVLPDGTERQALLLAHDYPFTDVAVLQVSPGGLTPIEPGDSDALVPGDTVLAIGETLSEFQGSVTVGIVSGVKRVRYYDGVVHRDFIQTDAAVNHGNSGGALVNLKGQLVGMPTSVIRLTETGQEVEGVAFALPADRVMDIAARIVAAGGPITRPSIGFEHIDLMPETLARLPRLALDEGALVASVPAGGAAAGAGIRAGDIVTMLGDRAITRQNPLLNVLQEYEPGEVAKVVLNRGGLIIETEVRLAKRQ